MFSIAYTVFICVISYFLFQKLKKELKRKRKEEAANRKITTEEMEDINEDYKNLKKRLKGKITEKQLDNKLGLD